MASSHLRRLQPTNSPVCVSTALMMWHLFVGCVNLLPSIVVKVSVCLWTASTRRWPLRNRVRMSASMASQKIAIMTGTSDSVASRMDTLAAITAVGSMLVWLYARKRKRKRKRENLAWWEPSAGIFEACLGSLSRAYLRMHPARFSKTMPLCGNATRSLAVRRTPDEISFQAPPLACHELRAATSCASSFIVLLAHRSCKRA